MTTQAPFGLGASGEASGDPAAAAAGPPAGAVSSHTKGPASRAGGAGTSSAKRRLDRVATLPPLEIAGVAAAVAEALAAVHAGGRSYGGFPADHVLLDRDGRPHVATPVGCAVGGASLDSAEGGDDDGTAADIAALGALITWMLDRAGVPAAHRRRRARRRHVSAPTLAGTAHRRRRAWLGTPSPADVLADLARRCADADRTRRPTARQVVTAIRAGIPDARLPANALESPLVVWPKSTRGRLVADAEPLAGCGGGIALDGVRSALDRRREGSGPASDWRPRRLRTLWVAPIVVVAVLLGVAAVQPDAAPITGSARTKRPGAAGARAPGRASPAAPVAGPPVIRSQAGVLVVDGTRFAVGDSDDVAVLTSPDCGAPLVAVLHRPTGAVHLFDRLPGPDETSPAGRFVGVVPDAVDLEVEQARDGCATLLVRRQGGPLVRVVDGSLSTEDARP